MSKKQIYFLSFFLPLITLIGGMIYFGVAPFGDKSLLIIDGLHQYMPFFSILYDKLRGGESLFYTFRTGLGINFLALFSYYLSSPFNLIIIFFQRSHLNMAVSFLIVLKLALSGFCASIYFTKKSKKTGIHIVAASVAYALNGYMVGYSWNVMWLDAIMVLPLILLGIERLIEKKDGRLYCLALFYALYCNYYIAFMICIFCVIWYLFYQFSSIKQFFMRGFAFAGYSFLAAGMSSVLLIPAYLGIKQTSSGSNMSLPEHSWLGNFWNIISRQYDMAYPISHDQFDGNANLYFGIFTILCVGLYFLNREIRWTEKIKKAILILFFYLSFNEEILNFIWHGFHNQYGIPNRFSFLYGFVLLVMVFDVLEHREGIGKIAIIASFLFSMGVLSAAYYFSTEKLPMEVLISAIFLIIVYSVILLLMKLDQKKKLFYARLLPCVMAGELLVTSLLGFDTNGQISISKFFSATKDMEQAIDDLSDGTFYRSELAEAKMVDESTWYPMNAISFFGSTARDEMVQLMNHMGFYTGCNEYLYKGGTPVTDLILNVKYLYYHDADTLKTNYEYIRKYGEMSVYKNPTEGMSIGYGIGKNIDEWYYDSDYPFRVLNDFTHSGYHLNGVFDNIRIFDPYTNGCTVENTNDGEYRFEYEEKRADNLVFTIDDIEKDSENLFIFYDGTQVNRVEIAINGKNIVSGDLDSRMLPLGAVKKGDTVTISMELKGEQEVGYIRLSAACFDTGQYNCLVKEMISRAFLLEKKNDHHLEGKINALEDQYLFFSIPYDRGWRVKIDGKNAETRSIGNAFLSVIIRKGEHKVSLDYVPEGFYFGVILSGISVILFLCLLIFQRYKDKKRGKKNEEGIVTGGNEDEEIWDEIDSSIINDSDNSYNDDSTYSMGR